MTTVDAANAHAIAIDGNFDDCQDLVKALFADTVLRRDLGLSAMNSINFARIATQIVYYVAAGLVLATNANDILVRYLASGAMTIDEVSPSLSPSMDIQVASNFERLLFELKGRNGAAVVQAIAAFRRDGALPPDDQAWNAAGKLFAGQRVDDAGTLAEIGDTYRRTGMQIDPHSAVAVAAARAELARDKSAAP